MIYEWIGFVFIGFVLLCAVAFYGAIFGIILTVLWWFRWVFVFLSAAYLCIAYGSDYRSKPILPMPEQVYRQFNEPKSSELPFIHQPSPKAEKPMTERWTVSDTKPSDWNISDSDLDKSFAEMKEKESKTP